MFFQKAPDRLFKEFVGGAFLVNGKDLESFEQLTVQRCRKSFLFSHTFLLHFREIIRKGKTLRDYMNIQITEKAFGRQQTEIPSRPALPKAIGEKR